MIQNNPVNCACVIHGDLYSWDYVEKLHSMLSRNFSVPVKLHVFTEATRSVPDHMVKHRLTPLPDIHARRRAWWYKMQMFNPEHVPGRLIYFDLDTVIVSNLDWMLSLDTRYFWAIHDYKRLWRQAWSGINSSVMVWDCQQYAHIWQHFSHNLDNILSTHRGDQDYIGAQLAPNQKQFFDQHLIRSWRWEIKDGGFDIHSRTYRRPCAGSVLTPGCSVMVFHGNPKPHQVCDPVVSQYWN